MAANYEAKGKIPVDGKSVIPSTEPWRLPDGSQLMATTLNKLGQTSGDVGDIMRRVYYDPDSGGMQNMGLKGAALLGQKGQDAADQQFLAEFRENNERIAEEHRKGEQRLDEQHRQEEKIAQERWQDKKDSEEEWAAKNRPEQDRLNNSIIGLPLGLASFGLLGLGLTGAGLSMAGGAMSGSVAALGGRLMVASKDGGTQLAATREGWGMPGPGAGNDFLLKGPNQTMAFTPGVEPEMGENGPMAPAAPGNRNQMGMGMPGMTPRMGA